MCNIDLPRGIAISAFLCQPIKKRGGGPKVKKKIKIGGAIMFDFKIEGPKSQVLQIGGPKAQLSLFLLVL
jgi:hypothetical protein